MSVTPSNELLPYGHLWLEDIAVKEKIDPRILEQLCEQGYIQAVKPKEQWAILVVNDISRPYSSIVVKDLQSGGNITIDKIVSQIIVTRSTPSDIAPIIEQQPIRDVLETARQWTRITTLLLAGGSMFFLVGLTFSMPVAAFTILPAIFHAGKAREMSNIYGDQYLINEARKLWTQTIFMGAILWCFLAALCLFTISVASE